MRHRLQLLANLLGPPLAIVALTQLGTQPWTAIEQAQWGLTPSPEAGLSLLRWFGLVVSIWLTVTTYLYFIANLVKARRAAALLIRITVPRVRRLIDTAVVTGAIVSASALTPALAAPPPIGLPAPSPTDVVGQAQPATAQVSDQEPAGVHEVKSGESFWAIAASLRSETDIAPYWLKMIELNLETIRSGDPNLIFPGELLLLPEF